MSIKPPCVKCELRDNFNGLFTCNGCRQHFCANHIVDHTNELRNRFEEIMNQFNLVKDMLNDFKQKFSDTHWKLIHDLGKDLNEMKNQIDQCQQSSNYSEQELDQWMQKLNDLKIQFTTTDKSPPLLARKGFQIYLAILLVTLLAYYINSTLQPKTFYSNVTFSTDVDGPIGLSSNKRMAEHMGPDFVLSSIRVNKVYSQGIHHIRLSFERVSSSSKTFIGIINEQSESSSYGWFIGGKSVISHNPDEYRIFSMLKSQLQYLFHRGVKSGDILEIELDCIASKITLINQRTSGKYQININLNQSPLPWVIILNFDRHGDHVRLL